MAELNIKVSEDLPRKYNREHVEEYLHRSTPGVQHTFMRNGRMRKGVKISRSRRKLTATI